MIEVLIDLIVPDTLQTLLSSQFCAFVDEFCVLRYHELPSIADCPVR